MDWRDEQVDRWTDVPTRMHLCNFCLCVMGGLHGIREGTCVFHSILLIYVDFWFIYVGFFVHTCGEYLSGASNQKGLGNLISTGFSPSIYQLLWFCLISLTAVQEKKIK